MLQTILIGLGSVVAPIIVVIGFIFFAVQLAIVIDELFETFFK